MLLVPCSPACIELWLTVGQAERAVDVDCAHCVPCGCFYLVGMLTRMFKHCMNAGSGA